MKFNFGPYSSVLLIFFFHGLVYSGLALKIGLSYKLRSSLWLSLILFLFGLYIAPFMLGYAGWYASDGYREVLFYLPLQQLLFIGPVFLFYLKRLLYPQRRFTFRDWLHFLPGTLYLLYSIVVFIGDIFILDEVYFYRDGRDKDFDLWYQVAGFVSLVGYFLLSLKLYQQYRKEIFEHLSYAEEIAYTWFRSFLLVFLCLLILRGLFFVINPEWGEFGRKFWYYLAISLVGYYLAIQGYKQSVLLSISSLPGLMPHITEPAAISSDKQEGGPSEPEAPDTDYAEQVKTIEREMEEQQLYKNPVLTLADVARELDVTPKQISQAINKGTDLNFNDFVNQFRVASVLREFEAGIHKERTLLGIALSCGFNSKSTFNRAFKKYTGLSPNEFIRKNH